MYQGIQWQKNQDLVDRLREAAALTRHSIAQVVITPGAGGTAPVELGAGSGEQCVLGHDALPSSAERGPALSVCARRCNFNRGPSRGRPGRIT
jgi:hypothetical protein